MREKRTSDRITRRGLLSAAGLAGVGIALPPRAVVAEPAKPVGLRSRAGRAA